MKSKAGSKFTLIAAAVLFLAAAAWARTYTLEATSTAPGATGTVDAKASKAGENTSVTVKVDHLARARLLTPPANQYVVWIEPQDGTPQNEAVLEVGDNEKGDVKTTTTASKFAVVITAENDAHPKTPSKRVILRANVQE